MELNLRSGANAILFPSGWGDGVYASYWGYDMAVCLVTDFELIGDEEDEEE